MWLFEVIAQCLLYTLFNDRPFVALLLVYVIASHDWIGPFFSFFLFPWRERYSLHEATIGPVWHIIEYIEPERCSLRFKFWSDFRVFLL